MGEMSDSEQDLLMALSLLLMVDLLLLESGVEVLSLKVDSKLVLLNPDRVDFLITEKWFSFSRLERFKGILRRIELRLIGTGADLGVSL